MNSPDINGDGVVNAADLSVVFANFGNTIEPVPAPIAPHYTVAEAPDFGHFVGVSMGFAVSPDNPRGWHPSYRRAFKTAGFFALMPEVQQALSDGKNAIWLWEPTGQHAGIGDLMAFASQSAFEDGCEPAMRETLADFIKTCNWLGLQVGIYSGTVTQPNFGSTLRPNRRKITASDIPWMVQQCAFWARMGVSMWGGDTMDWGIERDPALWERFILQLREHPDARDLTICPEMWIPAKEVAESPSKLTIGRRQFFLSQCYPILLCRVPKDAQGNDDLSAEAPLKDPYWKKVNHAEERALVPGCRGAVVLHATNWTQEQRALARQRAGLLGLDLITHFSRGELF